MGIVSVLSSGGRIWNLRLVFFTKCDQHHVAFQVFTELHILSKVERSVRQFDLNKGEKGRKTAHAVHRQARRARRGQCQGARTYHQCFSGLSLHRFAPAVGYHHHHHYPPVGHTENGVRRLGFYAASAAKSTTMGEYRGMKPCRSRVNLLRWLAGWQPPPLLTPWSLYPLCHTGISFFSPLLSFFCFLPSLKGKGTQRSSLK